MKRKIRKKRQLRLQQIINNNKYRYDEEIEEISFIEKYLCRNQYAVKADLPYYAYIYVDYHFGWELYRPKKIVFLYDRMSHKIDYSRCIYNFNCDNIRDFKIHVSYVWLGEKVMTEAINIDDMIHFENRNDSHIFDRSYYQIYIKCGDLKKNIYIHGAEEEYYKPFIWLLELFNDVSRQIPFEMSDKHGNWVDVHKYNLENNPEMFNDKD